MNTSDLIIERIDSELTKLAFVSSGISTYPWSREDIEKIKDLYQQIRIIYKNYASKKNENTIKISKKL